MSVVIKAENISKQYRLGMVGTGTIRDDLKRWYYNVRGKENPFLKIGDTNNRSSKGDSDYVWSLRDINFEINQGDSVGIIGRNGAGKSTLLKILSQVTQPTTGKIYTKGRIASLLEVGTGFHPEMTGRENIYLNGAILGMRKHEITRKFDEIVDFSGVERYIDTPVKRYSSGMYVRLAFAVAAHLESEILIVDEVLAVGDAEFQKKCLGKMENVTKGEGRTILFVSHNMTAIKTLCNKGILLEYGNVKFDGGMDETISSYFEKNYASDNLIFVPDFQAKDDFFIEKIWIENVIVNKAIAVGDSINISVKLRTKDSQKVNIHLGLYNLYDEKLVHLSNIYDQQANIIENNMDFLFTCRIDNVNLNVGTYYVNVSIHKMNLPYVRYIKALTFTINEFDFFGVGKLPETNESKILLNQKWELSTKF